MIIYVFRFISKIFFWNNIPNFYLNYTWLNFVCSNEWKWCLRSVFSVVYIYIYIKGNTCIHIIVTRRIIKSHIAPLTLCRSINECSKYRRLHIHRYATHPLDVKEKHLRYLNTLLLYKCIEELKRTDRSTIFFYRETIILL